MAEFELRPGRKSFGLGTGDGNFGLRDSGDALRRKVREAVERRELEKTAKMVGHQVALKDKAELARAQERRVEKERQLLAGLTREQANHQSNSGSVVRHSKGCPSGKNPRRRIFFASSLNAKPTGNGKTGECFIHLPLTQSGLYSKFKTEWIKGSAHWVHVLA